VAELKVTSKEPFMVGRKQLVILEFEVKPTGL
jgi:hypothetical protein